MGGGASASGPGVRAASVADVGGVDDLGVGSGGAAVFDAGCGVDVFRAAIGFADVLAVAAGSRGTTGSCDAGVSGFGASSPIAPRPARDSTASPFAVLIAGAVPVPAGFLKSATGGLGACATRPK